VHVPPLLIVSVASTTQHCLLNLQFLPISFKFANFIIGNIYHGLSLASLNEATTMTELTGIYMGQLGVCGNTEYVDSVAIVSC
jgi:hypothetical protein